MKNILKIVLVVGILGVTGIVILLVRKQIQNKKDREILNGMTESEFLKSIRPAWENKFISSQISWLKKQPDYSYDSIVSINPEFNSVMDPEYKAFVQNRAEGSARGSWETLNPNPLDYDWSRIYWLPTEIDKMGLNINHDRVQELIKKI